MPHDQQISTTHPGCVLFLLDQSGSMASGFADPQAASLTRAQGVADAVNRVLMELVLACTQGAEVRDRFHIGVITYGDDQALLAPNFPGLRSLSDLANHPLRVETRTRKVPDGAGGLVDSSFNLPVWFDPCAAGGTPMRAAAELAHTLLEPWVQAHPASFPPVVVNITDGESTDGNPCPALLRLRNLATRDGEVLVLNLLLSDRHGSTRVAWPTSSQQAPEGPLRNLVEVSSPLPESVRRYANDRVELALQPGCLAAVLNGGILDVIQMLRIGTLARNAA